MRKLYAGILVLGVFAVFLAWACADLSVPNLNEPERDRALETPGDVISLIAGSLQTWFLSAHSYSATGVFMSQAAFQHSSPWACATEVYSRIPRVSFVNDRANTYYSKLAYPWYKAYQAISAVSDGFRGLASAEVSGAFTTAELAQAQAFGFFTLGMTHATLASFYDMGYQIDHTLDVTQPQEPLEYTELMRAAMGYFDEVIRIASENDFTIPKEWLRAEVSSEELVRITHSFKARFMAQVARTPEERAALDWPSIITEVDAGIRSTYMMNYDWDAGWENAAMGYQTWYSWELAPPYWIYGMADQSGNYQEWLALPMGDKSYQFADGRNVLIITPDTRFPQGTTVEEQRTNGGGYFMITPKEWEGDTWKKPERGVWRWSWYKDAYSHRFGYWWSDVLDQPQIELAEMRLLKAEGLYRMGDLAGAASIINETRVQHGLEPTDGAGTNASCVPRLLDGSCGELWEMLKWEKRMETSFTGLASAGWWFDGRGWGDLWVDSPLQMAMPCEEMTIAGLSPCKDYGGPGGEMGSRGTSYGFPSESGGSGTSPFDVLGPSPVKNTGACDGPLLRDFGTADLQRHVPTVGGVGG